MPFQRPPNKPTVSANYNKIQHKFTFYLQYIVIVIIQLDSKNQFFLNLAQQLKHQ
jgi:hypothetical protein